MEGAVGFRLPRTIASCAPTTVHQRRLSCAAPSGPARLLSWQQDWAQAAMADPRLRLPSWGYSPKFDLVAGVRFRTKSIPLPARGMSYL